MINSALTSFELFISEFLFLPLNWIFSLGHDNRVKFWNISYLEKMEYERKRKPLVQKNKVQKKKKLVESVARELEHQLPSSGRINKRDFFQGFQD